MQFHLTTLSHVLLVAVLANQALALFYTKGEDKDYPRIGRRSLYTQDSDNNYPRMGRRSYYTRDSTSRYPRIGRRASSSSSDSADVSSRLLLLSGSPEGYASSVGPSGSGSGSSPSSVAAAFSKLSKRGVFTTGQHGYPRVGRRGGDAGSSGSAAQGNDLDLLSSRRSEILKRLAHFKDAESDLSGEEAGGVGEMSPAAGSSLSLEIMFMALDTDGDGSISKEEFSTGMRKYREENPLC